MVIHARQLKQKWGGETLVVFIGPCPAKKLETFPDAAALTFSEMEEWFAHDGMDTDTSGTWDRNRVIREAAEWERMYVLKAGTRAKAAAWEGVVFPTR